MELKRLHEEADQSHPVGNQCQYRRIRATCAIFASETLVLPRSLATQQSRKFVPLSSFSVNLCRSSYVRCGEIGFANSKLTTRRHGQMHTTKCVPHSHFLSQTETVHPLSIATASRFRHLNRIRWRHTVVQKCITKKYKSSLTLFRWMLHESPRPSQFPIS